MAGRWRGRRARLVAWALTGLVLVGSFLPHEDVPAPEVVGFDKALHVLAYALVALAWRRAGLGVRGTVLVGLGLAVVTEVGQAVLTEGRSGDVVDGVFDVVGICLGLGAWRLWEARRTAAASPPP